MKVRSNFRKYLNGLGYSDDKIEIAWERAKVDFPSDDYLTLEVITRDILRGVYDDWRGRKTGLNSKRDELKDGIV